MRYLTVSLYVDSNPMLQTSQVKECIEQGFRFVVPCDNGPHSEEDVEQMDAPVIVLIVKKTPGGNDKFEMEGENRWCSAHGAYIGCSDSRFDEQYGDGKYAISPIPLYMPSSERIIPNY